MSTETMKCPQCGADAQWVENKAVYGKNYGQSYMMWLCRPCDTRVGCHNNTQEPLGTMAGPVLRAWRVHAHSMLDPIWKSRKCARGDIYAMLAEHFGREIHMGESDEVTCRGIIEWAQEKFYSAKKPSHI